MKRKQLISYFALFAITLLFFSACNSENYYPKPRAYFRIDMPQKEYQVFDSVYPYKFEYPVYGQINFDTRSTAEEYWLNLNFNYFNSSIYFSYKPVNNNIEKYINDAHTLVSKLIPKADGIKQNIFENDEKKVYGNVYTIEGSRAASVLQFYLTDSVNHFVRGALYFNNAPNNDSLQPVIEFLQEDIQHLIESFEWKTTN